MTKIPPLPEPPKAYTDRGSEISFGYTADQMNAHALATWNAAIEAAAGQWDGCEYEGVGERIDIASAIRSMKEPQ